MAKRNQSTNVTFFKPGGLFKKCIGKRRGADGQYGQRSFSLAPTGVPPKRQRSESPPIFFLSHARAMFRWFAEQEWWKETKKWEEALTPARTAQTEDDDDDDRVVTYTIDNLTKLYAKANDNQKLMMLLGLNFAWGQKEIATCRKRHWKVAPDGTVKVKRRRHKRARNAEPVYAEWTPWPETWALAKARMDRTTDDEELNPKRLAFLTEENLPLVRRKKNKNDAIAQAFNRLCKAAKVENRGFYALRRTAIDIIDDIAGSSVASMMASHAKRSITGRHYTNRKWGKLHKALRVFRRRLEPMFSQSRTTENAIAEPPGKQLKDAVQPERSRR